MQPYKNPTAFYKILLEIFIITPGQGNKNPTIKRTYREECRSFVKQWVQIIKANFQALGEENTRDRTNTLRTVSCYYNDIKGAAGDYNKGILVGTGSTPVNISDYKLETPITHGSAAGQLNHKAVTFDAFQLIGSTARFTLRRQFENLSGGTITVNEVGIYARDSGPYDYCIVRDVLAVPQQILNGQIMEGRYTFQTTV